MAIFWAVASSAQSTALQVYQIFQEKCGSCHNSATALGGLDLEGQGPTAEARAADVYQHLYRVAPNNAVAAQNGEEHIYPGRPDLSYLFKKINKGLQPDMHLADGEGGVMPPAGDPPLSDTERELVRQWILYGAPLQTEVVDSLLLSNFYLGNAQRSFPDGPPPAPAADEGFQIHMGPFFLEPGGETEFFQKLELQLPEDMEVARLDIKIGTFSHHFILYKFGETNGNNLPHGLRPEPFHADVQLVAAVQEPTDLRLPENTALFWKDDIVLDLNAHYINYSATAIYQAEVYLNVYTQPTGVAAQEMHTDIIPNLSIYIPNDGNPITYSEPVVTPYEHLFLWGMVGHTHQYGTSYKVYKRQADGDRGEIIYDGACPNGEPGCIAPFFDYQHIPTRYFEPLRPIRMDAAGGIIQEASWLNDGPEPVIFGPTSDDEMMVLGVMYTLDTAGLAPTSTAPAPLQRPATVFPNPATGNFFVDWPEAQSGSSIQLFTATGALVLQQPIAGSPARVEAAALPAGLYLYQLIDQQGNRQSGKVLLTR